MKKRILTVGDLKKALSQFNNNLPFYIEANESFYCCGRETCYCSQEQNEFEVCAIGIVPSHKKNKFNYGVGKFGKDMPERVVLSLQDL